MAGILPMIHVRTDSLYTLGCYAMADQPREREGFRASELESSTRHRWRKGHLRVRGKSC